MRSFAYGPNLFLLLAAFGAVRTAGAVCLDEKGVSGYHAPLDKEMHAALGIVLGKVTRTEDLYEDPTDPQGITATIYTLRVSRELRGKTPTLIKIRSENDSGRFWMDVGVEYLLFLSRDAHPGFYIVDSCGNSGIVSNRLPVLRQIEQSAP
jgi:hypothetical protein